MSKPQRIELDEDDLKRLRDQHHELVRCSKCHEMTEYGESCCGATECESECPRCIEEGYK